MEEKLRAQLDVFDLAEEELERRQKGVRRRKNLDLEEEDSDEGGGVGGLGELPSDFEDEEVDEEEAFDEEDEERFGNLFSHKGKTAPRKRQRGARGKKQQVTLSESEEEEEEEEEEGTISLAEFLEENSDEEAGEEKDAAQQKKKGMAGVKRKARDTHAEQEDELAATWSSSDDEEEAELDEEKHQLLLQAITGPQKRQKVELPPEESLYPESEFSIGSGQQELTLDDLINSLGDSKSKAKLKKHLKDLTSDKLKVGVPLERPDKERIIRRTAFKQASKLMSNKWVPTVTANRRADHLSFPFNESHAPNPSTNVLAGHFEAKTSLEQDIAQILRDSGIQEEKIQEFEELQAKKLSKEEIQQREALIQKTKRLLFYQELKMKRRKKIKSKQYRKILKKQKERKQLSLEELGELDQEEAKRQMEKLERMRIEERMTQRHRNKGAWARQQLKRGVVDTESRKAISNQMKIREQLLKKQQSMFDDESNSDEDEEELERQIAELDADDMPELPTKGMMSMEFMKRGIQRQAAEAAHNAKRMDEEFREKMKRLPGSGLEEDDYKGVASSDDDDEYQVNYLPDEADDDVVDKPHVHLLSSGVLTEQSGFSASRSTKASRPLTVKMDGLGDDDNGSNSGNDHAPIADIFEQQDFPEVESSPARHATTVDINTNTAEAIKQMLKEEKQRQHQHQKKNTTRKSKSSKLVPPGKQTKTTPIDAEEDEEDETQLHISLNAVGGVGIDDDADFYATKDRLEHNDIDVDSEDKIPLSSHPHNSKQPRPGVHDSQNPWMQPAQLGGTAKRKSKKAISAAMSGATVNNDIGTKDRVKMQQQKAEKTKRNRDERELRIDVDKALGSLGNNAEEEENNSGFNLFGSATNKKQKELIKRAFANDDVVAEFEKEKAELMAEGMKQPEDQGLPGWGSWAGEGVRQRNNRKKKAQKKKAPRVQQPKGNINDSKPQRKDAKLQRVIINEKRDRKVAKYKVTAVPFPFTSREQYEKEMRNPVGKEWNTMETFQKAIKPRISVKAGGVVEPIKNPKGKKVKHKKAKEQQ
ncbi:Small-subunit processome, Utp14 [Balamuthia mandrillaris]